LSIHVRAEEDGREVEYAPSNCRHGHRVRALVFEVLVGMVGALGFVLFLFEQLRRGCSARIYAECARGG
jgi:hypothetical protein